MNKTLTTQLSELFGIVPAPKKRIIYSEVERFNLKLKSKSKVNRICGDYTETTRTPYDSRHSNNGGDYWEGLRYIDRFISNESSCDIEPEDNYLGGYIEDVPIIVHEYCFYGNLDSREVSVKFMDNDRMMLSWEAWEDIEYRLEKVVFSPWNVSFLYEDADTTKKMMP